MGKKQPRGAEPIEAGPSEESLREAAITEKVMDAVKVLYEGHLDKILRVRSKEEGKITLKFEVTVEAPADVAEGANVKIGLQFQDTTKYKFELEEHVDNPAQGALPLESEKDL